MASAKWLASTMGFQYSKPSSNTGRMRLLDILPRNNSGQAQYTLREVDLDHPPPCTALSYAWGDPRKCCGILVDERKLSIVDNLSIALKHIDPKQSHRLFWIDAACSYFDRSSIKNLRNLRSFIEHPQEPNRDLRSTGNLSSENIRSS
jgi:hypothetical protein